MAVGLYLDVHVPLSIADQLRRRAVDVVHAILERTDRLSDDDLLRLATSQSRVMFTFDVRFKALAEQWQAHNIIFCGLIYAHPTTITIGQLVKDLELIAKATDTSDWLNQIERLPL